MRSIFCLLALVAMLIPSGCADTNDEQVDFFPPGGSAAPAGKAGEMNASQALGDPVLEAPTIKCLGAYWIIRGDDNRNASVQVQYRAAGNIVWQRGPDMFRVEKGHTAQKGHLSELNPPADGWLMAGSIVGLNADTEYELRLTLSDPDGGSEVRNLTARTIGEPQAAADAPKIHVIPGDDVSAPVPSSTLGTEANPYRGLEQAQAAAKPGDVILLHAGTYAPLRVTKSGAAGKPIIYRAAGDGPAVIDGLGKVGAVIEAEGVSNVWFEGLTIRGGEHGVLAFGSSNMVIRRCHIDGVKYGIYAYARRVKEADETENEEAINASADQYHVRGFFIADNELVGPFRWGRDDKGAGADEFRGIQVTGSGHVICYNRVQRFKDGIDTYPSKYCSAIDIYGNEISQCMDDGIEMDFSERNNRCFDNRLTNVHQGISEQPIFGGPVYIFRNALYNVKVEPFKLHHNGTPRGPVDWFPSGAIFYHNTVVKKGMPLLVWSPLPVYNCVSRNNLFIGTEGARAYDCQTPMNGCDFDYDGFGGQKFEQFLKWNGKMYGTFDQMLEKAPVYKNARLVSVPTLFSSGMLPPKETSPAVESSTVDLRINPNTAAVDSGCPLPGFNDNFARKAPDLGAFEAGSPLPHYGPRELTPATSPATQPQQ